jgi:hypothetical protein
MAGRGPAPKEGRQNPRDVPGRGEWVPAEGAGWQHGTPPDPPQGLMPASVEAWETWLGSWFASFWSPEDVPGLRQVIRLYDQVERGEFQRASELRLQMDTYGITPKGQQDRRWKRPEQERPKGKGRSGRYGHLKVADVS